MAAARENRVLKRTLNRFETIKTEVDKYNKNTTAGQVQIHLQLLKEEWSEFKTLESHLTEDFFLENLKTVEDIEKLQFFLKEKLVRYEKATATEEVPGSNVTIDSFANQQQSFLESFAEIHNKEKTIKLPPVDIPVFTGHEKLKFRSFRDLFIQLVHNNERIPKIQKFQYLKRFLKNGPSEDLICQIPLTEENYVPTWEKVLDRYDKIKPMVRELVQKYLDVPQLLQPSAKALSHFYDTTDQVIRGLDALGEDGKKRDLWLIHLHLRKLDEATSREWAKESSQINFPKLEQFLGFLKRRTDELECCDLPVSYRTAKSRTTALTTQSDQIECPVCEKSHYASTCQIFSNLPVKERRELAVQKKLCFVCLSTKHRASDCRYRKRCEKCHRRHHTLLHETITTQKSNETVPRANTSDTTNCSAVASKITTRPYRTTLLPTAIIMVCDVHCQWHECRALLDSGSEQSFISQACSSKLMLQRKKSDMVVTGIAEGCEKTKGSVSLLVKSRVFHFEPLRVETFILSKLPTRIPSQSGEYSHHGTFQEIELADPQYDVSRHIDIILGYAHTFNIYFEDKIIQGDLIARKSQFGWIVGHNIKTQIDKCIVSKALNVTVESNVEETLQKFWAMEDIPTYTQRFNDDEECEKWYTKTTKRDESGRYIVSIPFKFNPPILGNSHRTAMHRFFNLEKKLIRNPDFRESYCNVMREYINMGHMLPLPSEDSTVSDNAGYYLPHQAVIKQESLTTKLRVVFDGSSRTTTGVSINDTMLIGPTLQPSLWAILLKFRSYKIAVCADIEKMYRQIKLTEADRTFQRVLWRENSDDKIKTYQLSTVTFGLRSSPFLAIRTLQQLGKDYGKQYPKVNDVIHRDFYVDDLLSGAEDEEQAKILKKDLETVLKMGQMHLRKWRSNCKELCDGDFSTGVVSDGAVKVLGLQWTPITDTFFFKVIEFQDTTITKRTILSEVSRIFDPLGWLAPSILIAKCLMQQLWTLKLQWDDPLPEDICEQYFKFRNELKLFESIKVPRFLKNQTKVEYHGFCDASLKGYGAAVYCRVSMGDLVEVNLVAAKTKVAPVKRVTIPKMELCGAHLLKKLLKEIIGNYTMESEYYAWCDSTIVLDWLSKHPGNLPIFVGNRTADILEWLPRQRWHHIRSEDNPADPASRGVMPSALVNMKIWWEGPQWLSEPKDKWPKATYSPRLMPDTIDSSICNTISTIKNDTMDRLITRSSSFDKIIRVMAYCKRFIFNAAHQGVNRYDKPLVTAELISSAKFLIRFVQESVYKEEITRLNKNLQMRSSSKLISLSPFVDNDSILRVGGRLKNFVGNYNYKHPVIIPGTHPIAKLIVNHIHTVNLHPGPTLTFHLTRQKYWITGGRSLVRQLLRNCVICFKYRAKPSNQIMGQLPDVRVNPARPFTNSGVDYAGPVMLSSKKGRGAKLTKGWIAVFICLVTKAVHLEVVSELTSEAFIAALQRFANRRGVPSLIYSDNGTNFVGAQRKLGEIQKLMSSKLFLSAATAFSAKNEVTWKFIPPHCPTYGGIWESAVKSVKGHLLKVTNNVHLTFEEMATLLTQIEAILNSRPLCQMLSNDPEYDVLTPAHFLIGSTLYSIPENVINDDIPVNRLTRWERIRQRTQSFWRRFQHDYIHNLQQKGKWQNKKLNLKLGDIVLIKDDTTPSMQWPLGKITQTHPDNEGIVRIVTILIRGSEVKRHINKLAKMPIS